ncbi:Protein prenylyltransferase superfamily protein [Klebsormidium nitens]|uniref:Protein prenylyltransferase superfamily protein n=1 Tax=Klebsormidium nitens TaxID=105231 RepID=A0A1Y1IP96_KLENI|nr:Protein prenylyltransferase superfamily protein [Klebsormidium nitens]|eukprot:GAQ89938.1 Protein prenylyltransferase superfamily protein [Klebsormidium nitens]
MDGACLILELDHILRSDPLIDEVGLVPSVSADALPLEQAPQSADSASAYDPSAFWVGDHKLAVALVAARAMYSAALLTLKRARTAGPTSTGDAELLQATQVIVIVNPEHYTAWNTRKRVLLRSPAPEGAASVELQLSALALSVHPKSEATWSHRRWVLRNLLQIAKSPQCSVLEKESALAQRCAELRPMNYRAWSHRAWAAQWMPPGQLRAELQASRVWAEQHVTDNCGLHYRRRLILLVLQRSPGDEVTATSPGLLVEQERAWLTPLLDYYQGREALWLHRRFFAQINFAGAGAEPQATVKQPESDPKASTSPSQASDTGGTFKGFPVPFPLWSAEQTLVDEVDSGSVVASGIMASAAESCAREEAFVTEVVERLRSDTNLGL